MKQIDLLKYCKILNNNGDVHRRRQCASNDNVYCLSALITHSCKFVLVFQHVEIAYYAVCLLYFQHRRPTHRVASIL